MVGNKKYAVALGANEFFPQKGIAPKRLDIELTERCNNKCVHCCIYQPADDTVAKSKELSTEQVKAVLREAADTGFIKVRFTGGEPLLRDDFEELYVFARKIGLGVLLFTNATLITPRLAEIFSCIPPLHEIEISLYGMNQDSYERVSRVRGTFESAWEGIHILLNKKVPFVVKNVLLPQNKEEMEQFKAWASKLPWAGERASHITNLSLRVRGDSEKKNREIKKLRQSPNEVLEYFLRDRESYLNGVKDFCKKFVTPPNDNLFNCGAGQKSGCVDAYGRIYPCMMLKNPDLAYELDKGTLRDAIKRFFPRIKGLKAGNKAYLKRCARCFLHDFCDQCPAMSWTEHGNLDTPVEHLCELTHLQACRAGLLDEGEKTWEVANPEERLDTIRRRSYL